MEEDKTKNNYEVKSGFVETLAGDMADVLQNDREGLVKKIIHGEEEHEKEKINLSPESKKNKLFMFAGIVLILLAFITLSFFIFNQSPNTVPVEQQFVPLIFNDQSIYIEVSALTKEELARSVLNEIDATKMKAGGLKGIYLTENKQIVGLRKFIVLTKGSFVPDSNTLFVSDNFMMGVVNTPASPGPETGAGFFILLKVRSNTDIFESLRTWEKNMLTDLHSFLGISVNSGTNYLFTKSFADGIVENKNARMLYDKDGRLILMYIFADDNSVIITDKNFAAHEIMLRLAGSQKAKQ